MKHVKTSTWQKGDREKGSEDESFPDDIKADKRSSKGIKCCKTVHPDLASPSKSRLTLKTNYKSTSNTDLFFP